MTKTILENPRMHQGARPKLFEYAQNHRENPTQAEAILWEALKGKKLNGHKYRRQHPVGVFILDFYCHVAKLSVEVDGGYHFTKEQLEYDRYRTLDLESRGILELRFTNEQVMHDLGKVLETILQRLESELTRDSPPAQPAHGGDLIPFQVM